ncbi:MerR family transcriptional regulator [Bogoriella caseilytica]|uniref:MerR-like DNA binding protein n=1 Tax=Bogoriella caseilytica TaxID=56055 RepID=A0A3N2BEY9_9MICO|nr:MerR family transcriptional regulator [Bogoriella caseilytica]ROR73604.1 MerR-like DNA binding protein [Bogoriella caseilytica]
MTEATPGEVDPVSGAGSPTGSDAPLTVAGVAGRLGVAASTLRTWARRYGLGPSAHVAGAHRKYTRDDVARLERMRALTLQGVAPADAARAAVSDVPLTGTPAEGSLAEEARASDSAEIVSPARWRHGAPRANRRERVLVDPLSVAAAAVEADSDRVESMLAQEIGDRGVARTWTETVTDALATLADRKKPNLPGVEPEAVLRAAFLEALRTSTAKAATEDKPEAAPVLVCAPVGHRLSAHVIGGALAEAGVPSRILGVPRFDGSAPDMARAGQAKILAVLGAPDGLEQVVRSLSEGGETPVYLLGEDAPKMWLPGVHHVRTLPAAVEEIAAAARESVRSA